MDTIGLSVSELRYLHSEMKILKPSFVLVTRAGDNIIVASSAEYCSVMAILKIPVPRPDWNVQFACKYTDMTAFLKVATGEFLTMDSFYIHDSAGMYIELKENLMYSMLESLNVVLSDIAIGCSNGQIIHLVDNEILNNEDFIKANSLKSSDGSILFNYNGYIISLYSGFILATKTDKVLLEIFDYVGQPSYITKFTVIKKKNISIEIYSRNLRL